MAELSRRGERRRLEAQLVFLLVQQQSQLHEEQFLEHQTLAGDLRLRERARQVHGRDRVGPAGQTLSHEQPRRQGVRQPAHHRRHRVHEPAQELGGDLLTGRVDGDDALRVHALPVLLVEDLVPLDHERLASALRTERPAQAEPHALLEHPGQVPLVEPHRFDRTRVVADQHADDVDPPPRGAVGADAHDLAADGRLLPHLQIADLLAVAKILVATREVLDEVADGLEAEGGQATGDRGRHVLEIGERAGEDGRVEGEARDRRPFVVPTAAEAMREWLPGHSTIIANAAVPGPMCVPTTAATCPWKV